MSQNANAFSIAKKKNHIISDPLVLKLWTGGQQQSINEEQKKSVEAALQNKFQLIQGPPGNLHSILYYTPVHA